MARFLVRRVLLTIPVLLGVATLVFSLIHLVPGMIAERVPATAELALAAMTFSLAGISIPNFWLGPRHPGAPGVAGLVVGSGAAGDPRACDTGQPAGGAGRVVGAGRPGARRVVDRGSDHWRVHLLDAPHLTIFPGLFLAVVVLGFNFLGDGLRDAIDPKSE